MFAVGQESLEELFVNSSVFASRLRIEYALLFAFAEKLELVKPNGNFSVELKLRVGAKNSVPRGRPI
jgi:hypothetical protein